jgi:Ca-activated chloride channel family protein
MRKSILIFALALACAACSKQVEVDAGPPQRAELHAPPSPPPPPTSVVAPQNAAFDAKAAGFTLARHEQAMNTEEYGRFEENVFLAVAENPLSTFSVDVDRASYSNVRRFLRDGQRPPRDAVRIEEMVNYFTYDYPEPSAGAPFSVTTEVAACPWNAKNRLMLIGLQSKRIKTADLPPNNLVFLLDVSGSMMSADKLPLVKQGLGLLVDQLRPQDRVAIVVYAGNAGLVLPSTPGSQKSKIIDAINALEAGGSTAGGEGIKLAYSVAKENFIAEGNNRVILATDGDFNVGVTSDGELEQLIESERNHHVFLTVLGFGTGNIKDSKMELLADKGNGNYAYVDNVAEARKVLVEEMGATLLTVAKDVKLQIEFNPAHVAAYRLIGYENRLMRKEDFNNDAKDAGDIGAGHSVTALYELVPAGGEVPNAAVDPLKYQKTAVSSAAAGSPEIATVKLRYKEPAGDTSKLLVETVANSGKAIEIASDNLRFAASVAEVGMLLRDSKWKGTSTFGEARELAQKSIGRDAAGYRRDFIAMLGEAERVIR